MNALPKGSISILLGVALCLSLATLLGNHFAATAASDQTDRIAARQATIEARTLTALVEKALARETDLAGLIENFEEQTSDRVSRIRVLRLSGARLLASTREGDQAGKRLPREEKPFFDLAKELKSGMAINRDEAIFRKRELALDPHEQGLLVTIPYFDGDEMQGVVQLLHRPKVLKPTVKAPMGFGTVLAAVFASLILLLLVGRLGKPGPKWMAGLLALALFAILALSVDALMEAFTEGRKQVERAIAEGYQENMAAARTLATTHNFEFEPPAENIWDSDEYRRPFAFYAPNGTLNDAAIINDLSAHATPLRKSLWANVALALLLYLFFAMGWAATMAATIREHRGAYGYVTPAMAGMLVLVFFPFFYGLALSFTGQTLYNTDKPLLDIWVGFDNYKEILTDWQVIKTTAEGWAVNYENFYWTAFITICWTVLNVTIGVGVGLLLALCLNVKGFGLFTWKARQWDLKPAYRAILVLPWALPTYVTALIWKGLFHKQFGPINQIIQIFGGEPVAWFDSVFSSFITGITVNGWLSFPFMMLICLGGLQSISVDMYEAAHLDGASRFQQFRYITLPSLKPTLIPAVIISVVWTFNLFNVIYLVSGGEPAGANEILVTQAYKIAFEKYQYGYAAAYSAVIFIILLVYGIFQNKMSNATEDIRS